MFVFWGGFIQQGGKDIDTKERGRGGSRWGAGFRGTRGETGWDEGRRADHLRGRREGRTWAHRGGWAAERSDCWLPMASIFLVKEGERTSMREDGEGGGRFEKRRWYKICLSLFVQI